MRLHPSLRSALDWGSSLARNPYFWGGVGGLLIVGLVAFVLVDAFIMPSYTRHGVAVQVPDVENRSFEVAQKQVREQGLRVERQTGRFNPNVEPGLVVDQNPPPQADVKPGRRVYLTVNAGEVPKVSLPDLNGISLREAKNRISSLGLTVDTVKADSIPSPYPNTVTRQKPAPGDSLRQGSGVVLWYSTGLGEERVEVPNVVGRTVEDAERFLLQRNLRALVINSDDEETSPDAPSPDSLTTRYVQSQGQAPGTRVRAGTEIRLTATDDSTEVSSPPAGEDTLSAQN